MSFFFFIINCLCLLLLFLFFFFKQKTAYYMRISDWSSDVCSSDLIEKPGEPTPYVGMPLAYNPAQRWYYYPNMQPDEVLVFKQCDTDHSGIRWSPHVAIDDPYTANAQPRVSFEARALAFF